MYRQAFVRVKSKGKIIPCIRNELGVNQGGNASPTFFIKHLSDLGDYLSKHGGVWLYGEVILHLFWADDLVLLSDSAKGLQKQRLLLLIASTCVIKHASCFQFTYTCPWRLSERFTLLQIVMLCSNKISRAKLESSMSCPLIFKRVLRQKYPTDLYPIAKTSKLTCHLCNS